MPKKCYLCHPKFRKVKNQRDFDIAFVGLKEGKHQFFYTLGDEELEEFAKHFELENPEAVVKLELDKKPTFLDLKFSNTLKGKTICDRCGDYMALDRWEDDEIIVKFSSHADEDNATNDQTDIVFLSRGESHINVYNWIIEMLAVMIPMNKRHPDGECNQDLLEKLNAFNPQNAKKNHWKGLDNINFEQ